MPYKAALAIITSSGFSADTIFVRMLHIGQTIFWVVVFATLAGTIGAYFLDEILNGRGVLCWIR